MRVALARSLEEQTERQRRKESSRRLILESSWRRSSKHDIAIQSEGDRYGMR